MSPILIARAKALAPYGLMWLVGIVAGYLLLGPVGAALMVVGLVVGIPWLAGVAFLYGLAIGPVNDET